MSRSQNVELTNMCMICDGEYVLVQKRRSSTYPGVTFPGGHVEAGEALSDAVKREVYEETGLTIERPRLCGIKNWFNQDGARYIVLLYKTDCFSGALCASDEGEVYWVRRDELLNQPLARDMDVMLRVFEEDDVDELFYEKVGKDWVLTVK